MRSSATPSQPIPRLHRPSLAEFRSFVERREPLVIEGVLDTWRAPSTWTFERLKALGGGLEVQVQSRWGRGSDDFEYEHLPFGSFVESVRNGTGRPRLGACPLLDRAPELWEDLKVPSYVGGLAVPPRVFIASAEAFTPLHFDLAHGMSAQIVGRKKVVVSAFRRRNLLRHRDLRRPARLIGSRDAEDADATRREFGPSRRWEGTLEPGDLLFLPSRRHHYLRSLEPTVSVSFFWHTVPMRALSWALSRFGYPVN